MSIFKGGPKNGEEFRESDAEIWNANAKFSSNPGANEWYTTNDLSGDTWKFFCDGETRNLFYVYRKRSDETDYEYTGKGMLEDFVVGYGLDPAVLAGEQGFEGLDKVLEAAFQKGLFKDIPEWLCESRNISIPSRHFPSGRDS